MIFGRNLRVSKILGGHHPASVMAHLGAAGFSPSQGREPQKKKR